MIEMISAAIGADRRGHTGRSLADHLVGTHKMLRDAGCDEPTCLAGGCHSVYGTNAFKHASLQPEQRDALRQLIGRRAEHLAWTFGRCNRPRDIEDGRFHDRFTGVPISVNPDDLTALRLIEAANLIEQGESLARWPVIRATWEAQTQ